MLIYATPGQYVEYAHKAGPANIEVLLREASILVADATAGDIYDTTDVGLPKESRHRDALRDATCAQVESWAAAGVDPLKGAGGQEPRLTVSAIDGASESFDTYLTAPDRANALKYIAPAAYRILRLAGLASAAVSSW